MKKFYFVLSALIFPLFVVAQTITLEAFGPQFSKITNITNAGSGDSRLYVVTQAGYVRILNSDGTSPSTPFLDIESIVYDNISSEWEAGLLDMAFHPNYSSNGYVYVFYSNQSLNPVVSRFTRDNSDPNVIDPSTEVILLQLTGTSGYHNGGELAFGPDGFLYVSTGDGGTGSGTFDGDPSNQSQRLDRLEGKILRIDVDNPDSGKNYGVPALNPYASDGDANTLGEIWANGLRNPSHFSFDSMNGDLWIADVGHQDFEEINFNEGNIAGQNYGWRCYEASAVYDHSMGCPGIGTISFPVTEYGHGSDGCAAMGGYRYRGTQNSNLTGRYFFADWCTDRIYILSESGGNWTRTFYSHSIGSIQNWVTFGEGSDGELYIAGSAFFSGNGESQIYKITQPALSVRTENNALEFNLLPNPAKGTKVTLNFAKATALKTINIYNIQGQRIKARFNNTTSKNIELNLDHLASGMYIVEAVSTTGESSQKKLIIN